MQGKPVASGEVAGGGWLLCCDSAAEDFEYPLGKQAAPAIGMLQAG